MAAPQPQAGAALGLGEQPASEIYAAPLGQRNPGATIAQWLWATATADGKRDGPPAQTGRWQRRVCSDG
ncbi:hypothetical protein PGN35_004665 [Nodosilinea sp. PGN35]|uniref:hypothetical protein n=1 Tax=Nodosilinea sp. PGN35 TaxID=3020489 RepID=UPI0023B21275|nr:hypothetical protein [Nodosilinea sp. TSF1-S3]MDF0367529.1 hypothetical protein [Nodosilinea sp. TSF1-S3]